MAIKTNLPNLSPARERYKVEIQLPSRGYACPEAFPSGMLTVYPWAPEMDEWVAKRTGGAMKTIIHDLLPKLCNLNGCPPERFIISEALLVWMVARSIKTDRKIQFKTACPGCGDESEVTITVPDDMERVGEKPEGYAGIEALLLKDSKDAITFEPTTVGKSRDVITRPTDAAHKFPDIVATLAGSLLTVNASKPDNLIEACTYIAALSPVDLEAYKTALEKSMPGLDNTLNLTCDACGHDYQHTLKFTETFFR